MKSTKLTPKQKEIFDLLHQFKTGVLRRHVKQSGTVCYRLMDHLVNPVKNVPEYLVDALEEKDLIERGTEPGTFILKATTEESKMDLSKLGLAGMTV